MKNKVKVIETESDVIKLMYKINYGSTYFICKNRDIISFLDNCLTIFNESIGLKTLRLEEEKFIDELNFRNCKLGDGLMKIVSGTDKENLPILNESSFYIVKHMNKAFNEKVLVRLDIDESLYGYAKKLAKNNLIFDVDEQGPFFMASAKVLSIYEQIVQAFYAGKDSISFDVKKTSVATVRCYASTVSKMSGNKIRCNISNGLITVQFKPMSVNDEVKSKILPLLGVFNNHEAYEFLMELADSFTKVDTVVLENTQPAKKYTESSPPISKVYDDEKLMPVPAFIPTLYGKVVTLEEYKSASNWQRTGYASQYNWENDIKGDVDMYPSDARFDDDNFGQSGGDYDEYPDDDF